MTVYPFWSCQKRIGVIVGMWIGGVKDHYAICVANYIAFTTCHLRHFDETIVAFDRAHLLPQLGVVNRKA